MDLTSIVVGAVIGGVVTQVGNFYFNQVRRKYSFVVVSATSLQVPESAPTSTIVVVALDSSNTQATAKITGFQIVGETEGHEYSLKGSDAALVRDGRDLTLANLSDESLVFEVLDRNTPGLFDLKKCKIEVSAGATTVKRGQIRPAKVSG